MGANIDWNGIRIWFIFTIFLADRTGIRFNWLPVASSIFWSESYFDITGQLSNSKRVIYPFFPIYDVYLVSNFASCWSRSVDLREKVIDY